MAEVAAAYPQDLDVLALAADALVNVTAWALWDPLTGEPAPGSRAREAERLLDAALALPGGDRHPFVLHLHIHLLEMSERPEAALSSADRLRGLVPDAGHLQHMPSHLDVLCGDYHSSIAANRRAVEADRALRRALWPAELLLAVPRPRPPLHRLLGDVPRSVRGRQRRRRRAERRSSRPSCCASRARRWPTGWSRSSRCGPTCWSASGAGTTSSRSPCPRTASSTARRPRWSSTDVASRMRRWATWRPRGRAREQFVEAVARVPDSRYLFNNTSRDILAIAGAMLDGEIAYREGRFEEGFTAPATARSLSTTPFRTTSHGAGCSRRATRTGPCCSNRAGSTRRRRCMRRTSAWTRR